MKRCFVVLFSLVLAFAGAGAVVSAEEGKTYEDTLYFGDDGEFHCSVPYGYTWEVDYIDGYITGEDVTICTTVEAYEACNPKWAITNILEKQEDGTYVAVRRPIVGQGTTPKIELSENQVAFVVHSGGSVPENCLGSYENWLGKVVACAIRKGDVFEVDLTSEIMIVYANGERIDLNAESSAAESEEVVSSEPVEETSEEFVSSAPAEETSGTKSAAPSEQSAAPEGNHTGVILACVAVAVVVVGCVVVIVLRRRKK